MPFIFKKNRGSEFSQACLLALL